MIRGVGNMETALKEMLSKLFRIVGRYKILSDEFNWLSFARPYTQYLLNLRIDEDYSGGVES